MGVSYNKNGRIYRWPGPQRWHEIEATGPQLGEEYPEGRTMNGTGHNVATCLDSTAEYLTVIEAQKMMTGEYPFIQSAFFRLAKPQESLVAKAIAGEKSPGDETTLLYEGDGWIMRMRMHNGSVWFVVAGRSHDLTQKVIDDHKKMLDVIETKNDGKIPVLFWANYRHGPGSIPRRLILPPWTEIKDNYSPTTVSEIEEFFAMTSWDDRRGKLVLWRGLPGLGKTYALRALCESWKDWATIHYISDPEAFLNSPDYLFSVVSNDQDETLEGVNPRDTRLIILEDAGELLGADARSETGQGLSRLLNVVDGFLGQSMKVVLLITTNEEKKKLHPAVARPGRCTKDVEFLPFNATEANEWLEEHGYEGTPVGSQQTLAELYALAHGYKENTEEKSFGFAGVH